MLEGIEILSQKVVDTNTPSPILICLLVSTIAILTIIATTLFIIEKEWLPTILMGMFSISMIIISIAFWDDHFTTKPQCYTEYKVICSDTVDFNKFNQK